MASLRQEAQDVLAEARDGIAWIVVWKEGRGWHCAAMWPDVKDDETTLSFDADDMEQVQSIAGIDPGAVIVNSWYCNLGSTEEMTRETLANALRWQYEIKASPLVNTIPA